MVDCMSNKIVKEIISWIMVFAIAIALAMVINRFVIYRVSSPTGSMENTIMINDKVFIFRLAYLFSEPKRGDIVVFEAPDKPEEDYIKRIIGLPGDVVEGIDGVVYVNGEPLEEDYLKEPMLEGPGTGTFGPFKVPEGHYFMMGDNRNNSADSRFWHNTYVSRKKIKGKAVLKYPNFKWLY
ncbi:MAG: signal peptidase I [Clostridiales bacterium]|nr:signal peptidase I [Clostridiales bacterium]